jgi:alkyldihydroxyacetonephosphate synthase
MAYRERSFWGWGYADRFPGRLARRRLGVELRLATGIRPQRPREPVELGDVQLAPSRLKPPRTLEGLLRLDDESRIRHTYGRAYRDIVRGFGGDFENAPDAVALPTDEEQIVALLDWASDQKVAVIPYGGGTSVVGGVEAMVGEGYRAVISLDLTRLDRVLEVDAKSHGARIQAGAKGPSLERQLGSHGLTLRHYPQSFEHSTLGGWIATRAGGHFATLYTHIDDLVESVRCITPGGVLESRRLPASGAGPSPDRLMLGSEGTLGVITEAWMRVRPRPRFRSRASVRFEDFGQAVEAVRALSQSGLYPSNCRLLDRREALLNRVARKHHVLLLGFESAHHPVAPWLHLALDLAADHGGVCPDGPHHREEGQQAGDAGKWRQAFFDGPYLQSTLVSLGVMADTFETACTWDRFESLHRAVITEVRAALQEVCGGGFITCRFTHVYPDGPAPYFTFLAPVRRGHEIEQWQAIKQVASETLLQEGGTITHHHAVGRTHRPWYERQVPKPFQAALRAVKGELDPVGILNPGVLI